MKELPLISSAYSLFDWQSSNGNATAEQTSAAYSAVVHQRQTKEFSRFVWNDLVDKLYGAMTEAGFTWDSTYGSVDATKINVVYGELTAKRFNALTCNIEKLINTNWKWSFDKSLKGYLGRARVYGVTETGKNADFVYGWYII